MWFEYLIGGYSEWESATRGSGKLVTFEVPSNNYIVECAYSLWGLNTAPSGITGSSAQNPKLTMTISTDSTNLRGIFVEFSTPVCSPWLEESIIPFSYFFPSSSPSARSLPSATGASKILMETWKDQWKAGGPASAALTAHSFLAFLLSTSTFEGHRLRF